MNLQLSSDAYLSKQFSSFQFACRKQIKALTYAHQTDVKNIRDVLNGFQCTNCKQNQSSVMASPSTLPTELGDKSKVVFKPIGIIRTDFPEKRAVPRQPTVCPRLQGCITLNRDVFNNPAHSLMGLNEFSHLWIIYHFHRNDAHAKAKVAPPRLGGERVGIFSTRSPHRPCPIGLSLVEIDRIENENANIYFFGTDMVDGTPVLDVKPFIPRYDSPMYGADFGKNDCWTPPLWPMIDYINNSCHRRMHTIIPKWRILWLAWSTRWRGNGSIQRSVRRVIATNYNLAIDSVASEHTEFPFQGQFARIWCKGAKLGAVRVHAWCCIQWTRRRTTIWAAADQQGRSMIIDGWTSRNCYIESVFNFFFSCRQISWKCFKSIRVRFIFAPDTVRRFSHFN